MEPDMTLSKSESEILTLLADELSFVEIAERLRLNETTVVITVNELITKTESKTLIGLLKEALRRGWIV